MALEIEREVRSDKHWALTLQGEDFRIQMLTKLTNENLLSCEVLRLDGKVTCTFELAGRCSFAQWVGDVYLDASYLRQWIRQMADLLHEMEGYLLWPEDLCLHPEEIYIDPDGKCYYAVIPDRARLEDRTALLDQMEEAVNEEDDEAMALFFRLRRNLKMGITKEGLYSLLDDTIMTEERRDTVTCVAQPFSWTDDAPVEEIAFEGKEMPHNPWGKLSDRLLPICVTVGLVILLAGFFLRLPARTVAIALLIIVAFGWGLLKLGQMQPKAKGKFGDGSDFWQSVLQWRSKRQKER